MDYGQDSYTTVADVQTYLARTLSSQEQSILAYVIPAVSRWIDRATGSCFDNLESSIPWGSAGTKFTQKHFPGGYREISIKPCQQIQLVQAINPYDFSVWYSYSSPLEYTAEPYDLPVKRSLRMKMNEFTGNDLKWPGDVDGVMVTALFTEFDYTANDYPSDIKLLANHIASVWLQNNKNTQVWTRQSIEGFEYQKNLNNMNDLLENDPVVTRVLQSREEIWLEEM